MGIYDEIKENWAFIISLFAILEGLNLLTFVVELANQLNEGMITVDVFIILLPLYLIAPIIPSIIIGLVFRKVKDGF